MIIFQKCFKITYQAENKQSASLFKFYASVCLQSLLPVCLSPSVPCMGVSPTREAAAPLPASPGLRRQTQHGSMGCPEPYLHSEQGWESPFLPSSPHSPQLPSSCLQHSGLRLPPLRCLKPRRGRGHSSR